MTLDSIMVLHCTVGNSDKVYIIEVIQHSESEEKYSVLTSWGRRTAPRLSTQVRVDREPHWVAKEEFDKVTAQKRKGGYNQVDFDWATGQAEITIPGYNRVLESASKSAILAASTVKKPLVTPVEGSLTRGLL